jgi:hypothetical protein
MVVSVSSNFCDFGQLLQKNEREVRLSLALGDDLLIMEEHVV